MKVGSLDRVNPVGCSARTPAPWQLGAMATRLWYTLPDGKERAFLLKDDEVDRLGVLLPELVKGGGVARVTTDLGHGDETVWVNPSYFVSWRFFTTTSDDEDSPGVTFI